MSTNRTVSAVVHSDPDILGGTPVFVGTRVPVKTLFDYLEGGEGLEVFLDEFPSVSREQAVDALRLAREALTGHDVRTVREMGWSGKKNGAVGRMNEE
jgi:uncharacterized protein (DUF433 family)